MVSIGFATNMSVKVILIKEQFIGWEKTNG
jgi:hypothetical protein